MAAQALSGGELRTTPGEGYNDRLLAGYDGGNWWKQAATATGRGERQQQLVEQTAIMPINEEEIQSSRGREPESGLVLGEFILSFACLKLLYFGVVKSLGKVCERSVLGRVCGQSNL